MKIEIVADGIGSIIVFGAIFILGMTDYVLLLSEIVFHLVPQTKPTPNLVVGVVAGMAFWYFWRFLLRLPTDNDVS